MKKEHVPGDFSQCTSTVYPTVDGRNPAPPDRYFAILIYKV